MDLNFMQRPIAIVGCGPGSIDYLTILAQREIAMAEVLIGADHLLDLFNQGTAERIRFQDNIEYILQAMASRLSQRMAVLVSGDPGLCSLARPVRERFPEFCRIIPGISSVQVAFARVGLDWTNARIVDAHSRVPSLDQTMSGIRKTDTIAILMGHAQAGPFVQSLHQRLGKTRRLLVLEDLTLQGERIRSIQPEQIVNLALSSRTIVLLAPQGENYE